MVFRLVTSVTLNSIIALILLYFTEFDSLLQWVDLYCLQNIVFQFWQKLTHLAVRSLCNS